MHPHLYALYIYAPIIFGHVAIVDDEGGSLELGGTKETVVHGW